MKIKIICNPANADQADEMVEGLREQGFDIEFVVDPEAEKDNLYVEVSE